MVTKPIAKSTGKVAGEPREKSVPLSLLLLGVFMWAVILVLDVNRGARLIDIASSYYDCAIPANFVVWAVLISIGQKILKIWGGEPPAEFSKVKAKPGPLEIMSAIWFFAILVCPLFVWILGSFERTPSNWRLLSGIIATVTIILPLVCVLPLLRYVRGRAAPLALAFLAVGTVFPALFGLESAIDFVRGPEWQTVNVATFGADESHVIRLSDGRMLTYTEKLYPALQLGAPQRFLVLRGSGYILAVR